MPLDLDRATVPGSATAGGRSWREKFRKADQASTQGKMCFTEFCNFIWRWPAQILDAYKSRHPYANLTQYLPFFLMEQSKLDPLSNKISIGRYGLGCQEKGVKIYYFLDYSVARGLVNIAKSGAANIFYDQNY
jgi:hypothetical protein